MVGDKSITSGKILPQTRVVRMLAVLTRAFAVPALHCWASEWLTCAYNMLLCLKEMPQALGEVDI